MKYIDFSATTVKKTLCPFCSFGCEFGVVFDDFGVKGIEYIKEGSTGGRLCPRGSAAALYLNHPRRLSAPMKNGKMLDWLKIAKEMKKTLENPQQVAVTFDRNITLEEYEALVGFCTHVGIKTIASTYFEPEVLLNTFLTKPFSLDEVDRAHIIIVLGDPFNQAPMFSHALINWKLANRKHRLVVVDSMSTHTSYFATDFLKVNVGTEPLLVCALTGERIEGVDIPTATGIPESMINDIARTFKDAEDGIIIACLPFGHTYDPLLLTESLVRLQDVSRKRVVPFVEFAGFHGTEHFGSVIDLAKKKKIRHLINFGELFPFYYPQMAKAIKPLNVYATSTLKFDGFMSLPVALNLEKEGTILTTFGKKRLKGGIEPASGVKTVAEILSLFQKEYKKGKTLHAPAIKIDINERAQRLVKRATVKKRKKFILLGEKIAYNYLTFFEDEKLKMNPLDAAELGITTNDMVHIESKQYKVDLRVKPTNDVDRGIVAVPVETAQVRGLFDFEIDVTNIITFMPTEVEIWRRE